MKVYWAIGHGFGNYELFVVKTEEDYYRVEDITKRLGGKIVTKGEF
ncbi:MAG: hypothetical protein AABW58_00895 [Nanoarchaeota archaeon]